MYGKAQNRDRDVRPERMKERLCQYDTTQYGSYGL